MINETLAGRSRADLSAVFVAEIPFQQDNSQPSALYPVPNTCCSEAEIPLQASQIITQGANDETVP